MELNAAGEVTGRNIYGTNLLMRQADGLSLYYMYNGHADVTALIDATTGTTRATYYYDAFGNIDEEKYFDVNGDPTSTPISNSIMYAGYQYDKETGLYYLNARMYDPKIARFLQEDTYTGTADDPLSLNLYTYCANNPLIYYDPTGHAYGGIYNQETSQWEGYMHWAQVPEGWRYTSDDQLRTGYGVPLYDNDRVVVYKNEAKKLAQHRGVTPGVAYQQVFDKSEKDLPYLLLGIVASPFVVAGAAFGLPEVVVAVPGAYTATTTFLNTSSIKTYLTVHNLVSRVAGAAGATYLSLNPDVPLDIYNTITDIANWNWSNMPMNVLSFACAGADFRSFRSSTRNYRMRPTQVQQDYNDYMTKRSQTVNVEVDNSGVGGVNPRPKTGTQVDTSVVEVNPQSSSRIKTGVGESPKLYSNKFPEDNPMPFKTEVIKKVGDKYKNQNGYTVNGTYQYVVLENGQVIMGKNAGHIDLAKGAKVQYAGEVKFNSKGQFKSWDNRSGHYQPKAEDAENFVDLLKNKGITDASMENFDGVNK